MARPFVWNNFIGITRQVKLRRTIIHERKLKNKKIEEHTIYLYQLLKNKIYPQKHSK